MDHILTTPTKQTNNTITTINIPQSQSTVSEFTYLDSPGLYQTRRPERLVMASDGDVDEEELLDGDDNNNPAVDEEQEYNNSDDDLAEEEEEDEEGGDPTEE